MKLLTFEVHIEINVPTRKYFEVKNLSILKIFLKGLTQKLKILS